MRDDGISDADELDFVEFIALLYKRRWLIIIGTVSVTFLTILALLFINPTYESTGFFGLNNLNIPAFKTYEPLISSPGRFKNYIKENGLLSKARFDRYIKNIKSPKDMKRFYEVVFAYSKEDIRKQGISNLGKNNYIVGLKIKADADTPQDSRLLANCFGDFVRDCILYKKLYAHILKFSEVYPGAIKKNENRIIVAMFSLSELNKKLSEIKRLRRLYPEAEKMRTNQVIDVKGGGYRFLSPVVQIVGIQAQIANTHSALSGDERKLRIAQLKYEVYKSWLNLLKDEKFGEIIIHRASAFLKSFFSPKNPKDDVVKEVKNDLEIALGGLQNSYDNLFFISGPTLPEKPVKPKRLIITIIAFFCSMIIMIIYACFLEWWEWNRENILNPNHQSKSSREVE